MKLITLGKELLQEIGITWGVPWEKGALTELFPMQLTERGGHAKAVQSWPMAYWPDGSIKWSGHAAVFSDSRAGCFTFQKKRTESKPRMGW